MIAWRSQLIEEGVHSSTVFLSILLIESNRMESLFVSLVFSLLSVFGFLFCDTIIRDNIIQVPYIP